MLDNFKLQNNAELTTPGKFNIIEYARTSLWRDLAVWTRAYLTSINENQEYKDAVFKKLYSIPNNFGQILSIIFGEQAAQQYITLLSQHIVILQAIITAMVKGDQNAVNENTVELYKNADARAEFFASINPYWEQNTWRGLFYSYINLTLQQITTFFAKDYDTNIKIFDRLMFQTTLMGNYFSDGVIRYIIESGAI